MVKEEHHFQELQYVPPADDAGLYAKQATAILLDIQAIDPALLVYSLEASAVLLFAGLRAQSPYHVLGPELTSTQRKAFDDILATHKIYRWPGAI